MPFAPATRLGTAVRPAGVLCHGRGEGRREGGLNPLSVPPFTLGFLPRAGIWPRPLPSTTRGEWGGGKAWHELLHPCHTDPCCSPMLVGEGREEVFNPPSFQPLHLRMPAKGQRLPLPLPLLLKQGAGEKSLAGAAASLSNRPPLGSCASGRRQGGGLNPPPSLPPFASACQWGPGLAHHSCHLSGEQGKAWQGLLSSSPSRDTPGGDPTGQGVVLTSPQLYSEACKGLAMSFP